MRRGEQSQREQRRGHRTHYQEGAADAATVEERPAGLAVSCHATRSASGMSEVVGL